MFPKELSFVFRLETYFTNATFNISWSFGLGLLLVWLYFLLLSGV